MTPETRCQKRWNELGINDEETLKEYIRAIFAKYNCQNNVLVDLYKMIFPDWDLIERIEGFPEAGNALWKFICNRFIEFDRKHHPNCFKGGAWLNTGFSANSNIDPWEISFKNCKVIMNLHK